MRERIEECFGWGKTNGPMRQTKLRRAKNMGLQFALAMTAFNLVRLRNLLAPAPTLARRVHVRTHRRDSLNKRPNQVRGVPVLDLSTVLAVTNFVH